MSNNCNNNNKQERVLVTGGSGLVGRCLEDELARGGFAPACNSWQFVFLSSCDGDLTNYQAARELFVRHQPTHVVHLAAKVGGLYANMQDCEGRFYTLNSRMNRNVLALSREFRVKRCLSCLSTCIFPDQAELPLDESKIHLGPPHASNAGYAAAKREVDTLNRELNRALDVPIFASLVPTNLYGPHDNFCARDSHVIPGLIQRAYEVAQAEQNSAAVTPTGAVEAEPARLLVVRGSGAPLRQFVFAPDLARVILRLLAMDAGSFREHFHREPSVIVSPDEGCEVSIGRAAEMIAREMGWQFNGLEMRLQFDAQSAEGQQRKTASNGKLRTMLSASELAFTPLAVGLARTIEWFCRARRARERVRGCTLQARNASKESFG